jgi:uncharacterized repeat protein (TIGR03809 family)
MSGSPMSAPREGRYDGIARRWLALVERRQAHLIELTETGRWRHYYTKAEFRDEVSKLLRVREQWAEIAGPSPYGEDGTMDDEDRSPVPKIRPGRLPAPLWDD